MERIETVRLIILKTEEKITELQNKVAVLREEETKLFNDKRLKIIENFTDEEISLAMELFQEQMNSQDTEQKEINVNENY